MSDARARWFIVLHRTAEREMKPAAVVGPFDRAQVAESLAAHVNLTGMPCRATAVPLDEHAELVFCEGSIRYGATARGVQDALDFCVGENDAAIA